ncbi:hypothetical protein [Trinickia sp. EG282A]|uniref:hypothetical protein n=1 Tax=Trinickia sp. EG282A TaxID=3237013 RepID=UPI0034D235F3
MHLAAQSRHPARDLPLAAGTCSSSAFFISAWRHWLVPSLGHWRSAHAPFSISACSENERIGEARNATLVGTPLPCVRTACRENPDVVALDTRCFIYKYFVYI